MSRVQNRKQLGEPPDGTVGDISPDQGPSDASGPTNRTLLTVGLAGATATVLAACCGAAGAAAGPAADVLKTLVGP